MARVLEPPKSTDYVAIYRDRCGALVEFERADVQSDQRDGPFVVCPACGKFIAAKLLRWQPRRPR